MFKFSLCFTVGCGFIIGSFFALRGTKNQFYHMSSKELCSICVLFGASDHGISILCYLLLSWWICWAEVPFFIFDIIYIEVLWQDSESKGWKISTTWNFYSLFSPPSIKKVTKFIFQQVTILTIFFTFTFITFIPAPSEHEHPRPRTLPTVKPIVHVPQYLHVQIVHQNRLVSPKSPMQIRDPNRLHPVYTNPHLRVVGPTQSRLDDNIMLLLIMMP